MQTKHLNEEFLYYIWQFKRWKGELKTLSGQKIQVEKPGFRNPNAGPDFLNAQIRINGVLWAGNVEIHVKSSDWFFHKHEQDENYKKLILHVVYFHDLEELPHDCPLLILNEKIPKELLKNFGNLQQPFEFIPCESLFSEADPFIVSTFIEALFIQRLEEKVAILRQRLALLNGDWEALLFERIAYVFGLKVNAQAFEIMAKSFPFKILQQISRKSENTEALLFGQAGFLNDVKDDYQWELQQQYIYLKHKYNLKEVENHLFKFLRLRPPNFPTVRIAQLAALYKFENQLFNKLIATDSFEELTKLFQKIKTTSYWDTHYNFGKESKKEVKRISKDRLQLFLLNAIIPVRYFYEQQTGNENVEKLLELIRAMPAEQNSTVKKFKNIGAKIQNSMDSQAFLELKKNFCDQKKCLNCRIGNQIIQNA